MMRIGPLLPSIDTRAGRRAEPGRGPTQPVSGRALTDHAIAPATAADTADPDRRPLPSHRALVPQPTVSSSRLADTLIAKHAYAARARQTSAFPAGSLLRLAV